MIRFYDSKSEYGVFSNFYQLETPIYYDNLPFSTSEHLYQYLKFGNDDRSETIRYRKLIQEASTPYTTKILGHQHCPKNKEMYFRKYLPIIEQSKKDGIKMMEGWDTIKVEVMKIIIRMKFSIDKYKQILLSTGDKTIVEHTHRDNFWGDGGNGTGKNHLGKILMEIRDEFINK